MTSLRYRPSRSGTFLQQFGIPLSLVLTYVRSSQNKVYYLMLSHVASIRTLFDSIFASSKLSKKSKTWEFAGFCGSFWWLKWNEGVCQTGLWSWGMYYQHFTSMQIAKHVQCLIAASPCWNSVWIVDESLAENLQEQTANRSSVATFFFGKTEDHWRSDRSDFTSSADVHLRQIRVKMSESIVSNCWFNLHAGNMWTI